MPQDLTEMHTHLGRDEAPEAIPSQTTFQLDVYGKNVLWCVHVTICKPNLFYFIIFFLGGEGSVFSPVFFHLNGVTA